MGEVLAFVVSFFAACIAGYAAQRAIFGTLDDASVFGWIFRGEHYTREEWLNYLTWGVFFMATFSLVRNVVF